MLSQFTREGGNPSLADIQFSFPKDVYPIGRLDSDSEGLLLLSNDPSINQSLLNPDKSHWRKYLVQIEGSISEEDCKKLEQGVIVTIKGKQYKSLPCKMQIVHETDPLPERDPPVRFRKNIPTSWVTLEVIEGKNRQVRKMTAAIGFPTLRLVRIGIEAILLGELQAGGVKEYEKDVFLSKLKLRK